MKLILFQAKSNSFVSLVMMEQGGWAIPADNLQQALAHYVLHAGSTALLVDRLFGGKLGLRLPNGGSRWCLFGSVLQKHGSRSVTDLALDAGEHVFLAAGCNQATDIDLEVRDGVSVIARDVKGDAIPMCICPTRSDRRYDVETSLPDATGPSLVLTGIMKVEVVKQAIRLLNQDFDT